MASFTYNAMDEAGQAVSGSIDAPNRGEAIAQLAARKIFVTDIQAGSDTPASKDGLSWSFPRRRRVPRRARAAMLRQIATALQAGLPLLSALHVVYEQADSNAMKTLLHDLAQRVQAGESLSDAMAAHGRDFSALDVSMVRVGETAGVLDEVMGHLADFAEHDMDIREKVRSAATYPIFVLCLAAVSVVVIITAILPRVMGTVMEGLGGASLPAPTRILLWLSEFLQSYGWLVLIVLIAAGWGFNAWRNRPAGRLALDKFKLRVPVLGTALRRVAVARFARTLGTLSQSGIQILEALHVLRGTLGNEALARKIDKVAADIKQGQSIAEPLRETGEFPPLLIQVIAMGEKTGRLDELLLQTANTYEKETTSAIQRVMTVLPAVFIVVLALVVVFILAAVLLPIIEAETALPGM
ncbi:MAG: type II secretion system F family protein [Phycisphaerae bacterium]|nr:type II secretion system F family protein [Phycisphaerae bacterium]